VKPCLCAMAAIFSAANHLELFHDFCHSIVNAKFLLCIIFLLTLLHGEP
jgi:hypothetical protein